MALGYSCTPIYLQFNIETLGARGAAAINRKNRKDILKLIQTSYRETSL